MADDSIFLIDIEKILKGKLGEKYKYVPRFLVSYLKRIVHQDELNVFLREAKDKVGVDFLEGCMEFLDCKVEVKGMENLPEDGKCTFVCNHPLGGQDGISLGYVLGKKYDGNIRYLVNDLLMNLKGMAPLGIPINKLGGQARNLPKLINEVYESECQMLVFPAGLCSRKINGKIQDIEWGKNFVKKSRDTGRDIVPIHFEGENSKRFYRIANWQKRLGLKFNVAMMLLPDEMYKSKGRKYKVTIGKPIPISSLDKSKNDTQWAQEIRKKVYEL